VPLIAGGQGNGGLQDQVIAGDPVKDIEGAQPILDMTETSPIRNNVATLN
jgi:hypothetical protein